MVKFKSVDGTRLKRVYFVCEYCGKVYKKLTLQDGQKIEKDFKFCSLACQSDSMQALKEELAILRMKQNWEKRGYCLC